MRDEKMQSLAELQARLKEGIKNYETSLDLKNGTLKIDYQNQTITIADDESYELDFTNGHGRWMKKPVRIKALDFD